MDLKDYREKIDAIDAELMRLFTERMDLATEIARYKAESNGGAGITPAEQTILDQPYYSSQNTWPPRYYQRIAVNRPVERVQAIRDPNEVADNAFAPLEENEIPAHSKSMESDGISVGDDD